MTHWTPPNSGRTNLVTKLPTGDFTTMPGGGQSFSVVSPQTGTSVKKKTSKSQNPTAGGKANRSNRLTSTSKTYGPTGVVPMRMEYHGPGCPDCTTKSIYTIPSAFSEKSGFTGGKATGYRE